MNPVTERQDDGRTTVQQRCLRVVVHLLALGLVAGCASPVAPSPDVELGTGTWQFESLADGQELSLVRGAQGGWHIWLGVRTTDLAMPDPATQRAPVAIELQPADELTEPQRVETELFFGPEDANGQRMMLGWPAIVADPACAVGQLMRVSAELDAADGTAHIDERYVMIGPGADPPGPCE